MSLREKKGFWGRMSERIGDAFMARPKINEELFEELEEILITSDIGVDTTMKIVERLREDVKKERLTDTKKIKTKLAEIIAEIVDKGEAQSMLKSSPLIILVIGINGGGKTTTIGKLAYRYINEEKKVLLAAADTFRAAASEQLGIWAKRADVDIIRHSEGADPSAVLYDAIDSAKAKNVDVLICDTAGRLQNKKNLMDELEKMSRIIGKRWPEAGRENLLILDATTGKNAISQAKEFGEVADITGVVITKLDGTAKGGIAITIADEFDLPIKFIGVGEGIEDLETFNAEDFAGGIFDE